MNGQKNKFSRLGKFLAVAAACFISNVCLAQTVSVRVYDQNNPDNPTGPTTQNINALEQKNDYLVRQIHELEKSTTDMDRQIKALDQDLKDVREAVIDQKARNQAMAQQKITEEALLKEKRVRVQLEGVQVSKEIMLLEKELLSREKQELSLTNNIKILTQEIGVLKNQMIAMEHQNKNAEKKVLRESILVSEKKITQLNRELEQVKKKYRAPTETLEKLKADNFLLKQQAEIITKDLKDSLKNKDVRQKEYEQKEQENQKQVLKLTEDIEQLKTKKKNLEEVLAQAELKLKEKKKDLINPEEGQKEIERLQKTLDAINDENLKLEEQKNVYSSQN
ncbi:MAG: hypothetical protein HQL24_00250 [Candidatus Omnitrophica bacterium]|nr:hypothetical protein [Candidatus Omnitrophota bacterium]